MTTGYGSLLHVKILNISCFNYQRVIVIIYFIMLYAHEMHETKQCLCKKNAEQDKSYVKVQLNLVLLVVSSLGVPF